MATPFLGEIKLVSFNFAPKGWAMCNGQLLPINQNQALFALFGTMYGGNGQTNFALPDLRGRVPIHFGSSHIVGERAGTETVTLTAATMPQHIHVMQVKNGPATLVGGAIPAATKSLAQATAATAGGPVPVSLYGASSGANAAMGPTELGNVGGSQPHTNLQPFLTLNYVVALQGIFPSQN